MRTGDQTALRRVGSALFALEAAAGLLWCAWAVYERAGLLWAVLVSPLLPLAPMYLLVADHLWLPALVFYGMWPLTALSLAVIEIGLEKLRAGGNVRGVWPKSG